MLRIISFIFKKQIDTIVEHKLTDIVLEKYIEENLFIANGDKSPDIQFKGKHLIKLWAASLYDLVKDAENYIVMDLNSEGYEPLTVTIQKRWKLSPHDRAEKLKKENDSLTLEVERLLGNYKALSEYVIAVTDDPEEQDEASEAGYCRKRGWDVGTRLEGEEICDGVKSKSTIMITALGEKKILAKCYTKDGWDEERSWTLKQREWKKID